MGYIVSGLSCCRHHKNFPVYAMTQKCINNLCSILVHVLWMILRKVLHSDDFKQPILKKLGPPIGQKWTFSHLKPSRSQTMGADPAKILPLNTFKWISGP